MANKRTRERQLAKLAARRQAERAGEIRRRNRIIAGAAGVLAAAVVATAGFALIGDGDTGATSPTPSVSTTPGPTVACHADVPKAAAKQPKPTFDKAPRLTIDPKATYSATMVTSCGTILIALDAKDAPETVNSFAFLSGKRFYDGLTFHRIDSSIDVIQGGDPAGDGTGGPGYTIPDELTGDEAYLTGTVAMAKSAAPDSGGSQFFIIYGPNGESLPKDYTIFGHVTEGLDVVKRIARIPVGGETGQQPTLTVYIESVTVTES